MRKAEKTKSQFSKKLIELRQARGLTQEQLASELGISRNLVAYYEAKVENPTAKIISKISNFFNIPPDQFLIENGSRRIKPGPTSKLEHQLELVRKLPKEKQKAIATVLDLALQNVDDSSKL